MATQVGEAVIKLSFDGKNLTASVQQQTKEVEKASSKIKTALGKVGNAAKTAGKAIGVAIAAGVATASAAVIKLGKDSLNAFADYEQLVGGVETLFKDGSETIFNYANEAYKTAGLSANQYMEQATSFSARLIQGLGGDTAKAAEYANKAIVDMSDNANKMGTSIEMIQSAYQGFAKQNYTMLDNLKLGYGGTASEMARLINDSGVLGNSIKVTAKTVNDVSFDKMIEAIHKVQENLGITGTTAQEAADTVSGSINTMKAAWQNLLVAMGSEDYDWPTAVDGFVESLTNVVKNIGPRIMIIAGGIAELVKELAPVITQMIPKFIQTLLPPVLQAIIQLAVALIPMIPQIIQIIVNALVQNMPLIIQGLMEIIPQLVGMIPAFVGAALQIFGAVASALLGKIGEWFGNLFGKIGQALPYLWAIVSAWLGGVFENIGKIFEAIWAIITSGAQGAWEGIMSIFGAVAEFFGNIFGAAWEAVKKVFSTGGQIFMGIVDGIANAFRTIVNAIISGINAVVAVPFNAINGFLDVLRGIDILGFKPFGWVGQIGVPQIPLLAQGGYANGATTAVIGEAGKEVVLPLENNTDNWAGLLASELAKQFETQDALSGRPITVNMTNEINNEMDAQDIGRVLMESIRRAA